MRKIKDFFLLTFHNLNVLILILFYLSLSAVVFFTLYKLIVSGLESKNLNSERLKTETHFKYNWSEQYFEDENNLKGEYRPIIGFKEKKFSSENINVDEDGCMVSRNNSLKNPDVIFLGGSTMFGYGSNDLNTIPSLFSEILNDTLTVRNLGNGSHNSTQSLLKFYDLILDGTKPKYVISYEGVNEMLDLLVEKEINTNLFHSFADYFRQIIDKNFTPKKVLSFKSIFTDYTNSIRKFIFLVLRKIGVIKYRTLDDLHSAEDLKIEKSVKILLENWKLISLISKEKGIKCFLYLQPHLFSNKHKNDYLKKFDFLEKYYTKLYPMIIKKINSDPDYDLVRENFYDLSRSLDDKNAYFYDYCHLNPLGNKIISEKIIRTIFQ